MFRLDDSLDDQARENGDVEFAADGRRQVRVSEAPAVANQLDNGLISEVNTLGDRVAYLSKSSIEFAIFDYGCSKTATVPIPLKARLAPSE